MLKKLGYYVILITARPTFDRERVLGNLELIGVDADAVFLYPFPIGLKFTRQEYLRLVKFKPLFRSNLEKLNIESVREITSDELYHLDSEKISEFSDLEKADKLNIVMTIGDQEYDISETKTYGILLPAKNRIGLNVVTYYFNNKMVL